MTGVCKWFSDSKGWGFISAENGEDFFVHWRTILGSGHRSLYAGDRCQFTPSTNERGKIAVDVLALQAPERER